MTQTNITTKRYSMRPWIIMALLAPPSFLGASYLLTILWSKPELPTIGLRNVICFMPQFAILPFMVATIAVGVLQSVWRDNSAPIGSGAWFLRKSLPVAWMLGALVTSVIISALFFAVMI